jgi:poly(3-hydroxybutyrate) depolymerase
MDFWFKNNLRASAVAAPVMTACNAAVSGNSATITGSATDAAGAVSSYRVVLSGATAVNDTAAGSGASFSIGYALANGYYTGSVTATDSGTGRTSAPCNIAQFLVGPVPAVQAPTGLTVTGATASAISLSWTAAGGATGYHVYRNGAKVTATPIAATSYTSTGLAAATSYNFQASSVNSSATESALSGAVTGTTGSGFTCSATTSSNYAHVTAGRAHDSGGYALANGSNQNMGLNNTFYAKTLAQTAAGYYIIGTCP